MAAKARLVVQNLLSRIGRPNTEVFPKQDRLDHRVNYGNFINAPLFGRSVSQGRTIFVDPAHPARSYPDQWSVLENVDRVTETALDVVIADQKLLPQREIHPNPSTLPLGGDHKGGTHFSLPACMRRILSQGVSDYQRVVCFRLAISLKRVGLPYDIAVSALKTWAQKNRPGKDKKTITSAEIVAQTSSAYNKDYRSYGCEDPAIRPYCEPQCPVYRKRDNHRPPNSNYPVREGRDHE